MRLFKTNTEHFSVLKLFKVTDQSSSENFPMKSLILESIESVTKLTNIQPTHFNLNYSKDYSGLAGFKSALSNLSEITFCQSSFFDLHKKCMLMIDNPMVNHSKKPINSTIDIYIEFPLGYLENDQIITLAKDLLKRFEFDYGYLHQFPKGFNGLTERKMSGGLSSKGDSVTDFDSIWTFHSVGMNRGYLKNFYAINFLNKSHLENETLNMIVNLFGIKKQLSDNIFMWTISYDDIDILKKLPTVRKYIIETAKSENEFLKSEEAKSFNALMKLQ